MSKLAKVTGVLETLFSIGKADQVRFDVEAGDVLNIFESDGVTLANVSGADAVDADHFVTLGQINALSETGSICVPVAFGNQGGFVDSTAQIPAGYHVVRVWTDVTTAFDGTAPTIDVGIAGDTAKFGSTSNDDNCPDVVDAYICDQRTLQATDAELRVSVGGSGATQGAATVYADYIKIDT